MGISIITDFDLDGVCSKIFANKYWNFDQSFCQGYKNTDKNLAKLDANNHVICADISLMPTQMHSILKKHPTLLYFDHHQPSLEYPDANNDRFMAVVDEDLCSAMLVFNFVCSLGYSPTSEEEYLARLVNTYDLWKTESDLWDTAYNLNLIYWKLGYWDFEKRFKDGFSGFTDEEQEYLDEYWKNSNEAMETCPYEDLDSDTILVSVDRKYMTETTFYFDRKLYFILYYDQNGLVKISVRARDDSIDVNDKLQKLEEHPMVKSAGGHKQAGGICLENDEVELSEAIDFIKSDVWSLFKK